MRKNLFYVFFVLITVAFLSSCNNNEGPSFENHALNQKTTLGFYSGDPLTATFTYLPYAFQTAYGENAEGYLYRLTHALELQTFQLSSLPKTLTPNQNFEAKLVINGIEGRNFDGTVNCVATQINGSKVWILDTDHNYGFIIEYK